MKLGSRTSGEEVLNPNPSCALAASIGRTAGGGVDSPMCASDSSKLKPVVEAPCVGKARCMLGAAVVALVLLKTATLVGPLADPSGVHGSDQISGCPGPDYLGEHTGMASFQVRGTLDGSP